MSTSTHPSRLTIMPQDASELRKAAGLRDHVEAAEVAYDELRQRRQLDAMGQLTYGIAHDFNNILTVITGTIDILADAVKDRPHLARIADLISEAAARGADLTRRLTAFGRHQALQPRSVDINAFVDDAACLLRPTLGNTIIIETRLARDLAPALIDPGQLWMALLNLATNALDAMPGGGKLILETANAVFDKNSTYDRSDIRPGNYIMIAVTDTGRGIPDNLLDRVFEPFFTTKRAGKGSGLGLSMVDGFVMQSNGHIRIDSAQGRGTTVTLYLPASTSAPEDANAGGSITHLDGDEAYILLVEDNPVMRDQVMKQISALGCRALAAADAAEALAIVRRGERVDLLLTDLMLPGGMNGHQLANEAAKWCPGLKVLYTSGYPLSAVPPHGQPDPDIFVLPKPYPTSELGRLLRAALSS